MCNTALLTIIIEERIHCNVHQESIKGDYS